MLGLFVQRNEEPTKKSRGRSSKFVDPITGKTMRMDDDLSDMNYQSDVVAPDSLSIDSDCLISEIYEKNEIGDLTRSIYKAEEFLLALPATLPEDVKTITCCNILKTSGFDPSELIDDGERRIEVIRNTASVMIDTNIGEIESLEDEIRSLEEKIQEHKQKILDIKKSNESIKQGTTEEMEKIEKLIVSITEPGGEK